MPATFFTIGVIGTTHDSFFGSLAKHKITHFCDIRLRRGLRGSKYKYANASELQETLEKMNIEYRYAQDLAPSHEVREIQFKEDKREKQTISEREDLSPEFVSAYKKHVLAKFDVDEFITSFPKSVRVVLFCVEHTPNACHRSLVAKKIADHTKKNVKDITP